MIDWFILIRGNFLHAGGGATSAWRNWGWAITGTVLTMPVRITAMKYLHCPLVISYVLYAENYVKPGADGLVHTNSIEVGTCKLLKYLSTVKL